MWTMMLGQRLLIVRLENVMIRSQSALPPPQVTNLRTADAINSCSPMQPSPFRRQMVGRGEQDAVRVVNGPLHSAVHPLASMHIL